MKLHLNCKQVFRSRHFRSLLSVLLSLWLLALGLVAGAEFYSVKNSLSNAIQTQMSNVILSLSGVLSRTQANAVTVAKLDSINTVISSPAPSIDQYRIMSTDLCSTTALYDYRSVDLFMENAQEIYVTNRGLYSYCEYPDPELLTLLAENKPYELWLVGRKYKQYYLARNDGTVLTYIRRLPLYHSDPAGYAVFHIPMEYLHRLIQEQPDPFGGTLLIGLNGQTLYSGSPHFACGSAFPSQDNLAQYAKDTQSRVLSSNLNAPLECRYVLPNAIVLDQFFEALLHVLPAFGLFLLLLLSCAFGYSFLMLGPLERILHRTTSTPCASDGCEYQQLSSTMSSLSSCIDLLTSELQRNLPAIQERYIIELATNYTDISSQSARYEEVGISLPYNQFVVILVDCSNMEGFSGLPNKEQLKLLIRDRMTRRLSCSGIVYSANIAQERLLFLVNSQQENLLLSVKQACTDALCELQSLLPQSPLVSVGSYTAGAQIIPYYAYLQARRNMIFFHGSDDGEPLMSDASAPILPSIDSQSADAIIDLLLDHDIAGLESYLENLFRFTDAPKELEPIRTLSISCLCITLTHMIDLELDVLPELASSTLKKLSRADSRSGCIKLLLDYFLGVISGEKQLPAEAERHVSKAIAFIQEHYTENITVPQIAASVALSPIYLNKLFKLSTGQTISGYLNLVRAAKAKELLASTSLTLNEISSSLGYNDVRSLVRFFKKYHGMSPGEYRQSLSS